MKHSILFEYDQADSDDAPVENAAVTITDDKEGANRMELTEAHVHTFLIMFDVFLTSIIGQAKK